MKKRETRYLFTSLTRISNLELGFTFQPIPKENWSNGDYVVCKVIDIGGSISRAELPSGRMMQLMKGDMVVGALGVRHATLEATGTWEAVEEDGKMELLTGAGLFGKLTSRSVFMTPLIQLQYKGHVFQGEEKRNMTDFVPSLKPLVYRLPTILLVGTSMSSGKTTSARIIIRQLKHLNLKVVGAKLTGAGRYRDILSMHDAGADHVFDFVDAGLPSSICPDEEYQAALQHLLTRMMRSRSDVAVVEIGASPLEPYNGELAIAAIKDHLCCTVLCASDPYSVLGVMTGFGHTPDIVSGPAANTLGGVDLIRKMCRIEALNLIEEQNLPVLKEILVKKLGLVTNDKSI